MNNQSHCFWFSLWQTQMQMRRIRREQQVGRLMLFCFPPVLVEVTGRLSHRPLPSPPPRRSTTVPVNLSREAKAFSRLLTSLPYQQVSRDTAWGGRVSRSCEKQSRECVILSVSFCSACFPTTISIWCQRLFAADDFLQNTLRNDSFLESTLLCRCSESKMCYAHLIPSFLVSVLTCVLPGEAGLAGEQANFRAKPWRSLTKTLQVETRLSGHGCSFHTQRTFGPGLRRNSRRSSL